MGNFGHSWTRGMAQAIGLIFPGTAIGFIRKRQALSSWAAASTQGPNRAWRPSNKSADEMIKTDHKLMRSRARSLVRDSSHVAGALRKITNNVVFKGINPQAQLKGSDGKPVKDWNSLSEARFKEWAAAVDFHEKENLILRHWWMDGELFIHYYFDEDLHRQGIIPLGIELLECDHLDTSVNEISEIRRTKQGIVYNSGGKPDGYWLFRDHPGDNTWLAANQSDFFSARNLRHLFIRERISQNRGVSWLASVIMEMRDFSEYQSSERIAKRLLAAFGLWVTTPYPEQLGGLNPFGGSGEAPTIDGIPDYMESGRVQVLPPGMKVEAPDMGRPGPTYEPYTKTSLRGASTGFSLSYEAFSNDYSDASFASARSATLEERRGYMVQQFLLAKHFHNDVWPRLWMLNRLANIEPSLPEIIPVTWQMPGWPWVDPLKDSKAAVTDIQNGLTSRRRLCAERGIDYDEIQEDLKREAQDFASAENQTGANQ